MSGALHGGRLHDLARQFRDYLAQQTNVDLVAIDAVAAPGGPAALRTALERLDAALGQLADLQSVYSDSPTGSLEPLLFPVAALTGEYMRAAFGGQWQTPDDALPGEDALLIVIGDQPPVDLLPIVRASLLAAGPNLAGIVGGGT
ncbi:MAG TPA: hypothetical protein VMM78_19280 [Thermomicrobiales bacterium]|nr:hypothetical protein [Thermomicrobiales bacterium]